MANIKSDDPYTFDALLEKYKDLSFQEDLYQNSLRELRIQTGILKSMEEKFILIEAKRASVQAEFAKIAKNTKL